MFNGLSFARAVSRACGAWRTSRWLGGVIVTTQLCVSIPVSAQSETPSLPLEKPTRIQISAVKVVERMMRAGWTEFSGIPLANLKTEILSLDVQNNLNVEAPPTSGSRRSAFYLPNSRKIIIRDPAVHFLPAFGRDEIFETLGLHEALGALGIEDSNYQLSLRMSFLSRDGSNQIRRFFATTPAARTKSGGSTSVGGGGDASALRIKYETLKVLLRDFDVDAQLVHKVLEMGFEPGLDWDDDQIRFFAKAGARPIDKALVVRLPVRKVNFMERKEREKWTVDFAGSLLSLYGANPSTPMMRIGECDDGTFVEMPSQYPPEYKELRLRLARIWLGARDHQGLCRLLE